MKKIMAIAFVMALAAPLVFLADAAAKEKKAAGGAEARWHGLIVRVDKDGSFLDVRNKSGMEKRIHFDSNTKWTKGKGTFDMAQLKEGDDVICLGKYDDKKEFWAAQVDLRRPK